jgi:hypothetical protein
MGDSKMKLKKGDRVKLLTNAPYGDSANNPVWDGNFGRVMGTVYEASGYFRVKWDNGSQNSYVYGDLELIEERFKPLDDLMKFIEEELVI